MKRRHSAFTLVEVLVWLAIMAFFVSMMGWLMVSVMDGMRRSRRAVVEATVRLAVLERVGADVRSSSRILAQHGGRKTGDGNLLLEGPDSVRVLYRFEGGILYRETKTGVVPVGRLEQMTFSYDRNGPAASRWVEVRMPGKPAAGRRFYLLNPEVRP